MSPSPPPPQLLILGRRSADELCAALGEILPTSERRILTPDQDWPAWTGTRTGLLVVRCNDWDLAELKLLHHLLRAGTGLRALLLVGDRGLAGCEELLTAPGACFLPEPWTRKGLAQVVQRVFQTDARSPDVLPERAFLDGLVEGLRNPLASLSGYLQILLGETEEREGQINGILGSALRSAQEMARLLEVLQLAAGGPPPRNEDVLLEALAAQAVSEARQEGVEANLEWEGEGRVRGDPRRLAAALFAARLFLERFGTGAVPTLCGGPTADGGRCLVWETRSAPDLDPRIGLGRPSPPSFLPQVLERLAEQAGARRVLEWEAEVIPSRAGLDWPPTSC